MYTNRKKQWMNCEDDDDCLGGKFRKLIHII